MKEQPAPTTSTCKPFLRWAGGKTWFKKHIDDFLPNDGFNDYHEPFLGGGSIFFHVKPKGKCYLSDLNKELVETYCQVRDDVEGVISEMAKFTNTKEEYYRIRNMQYRNSNRRAARFVFLNQTSFNGLYRVNLKGQYNVPYGFRTKNFFEPENLRNASKALSNSELISSDFSETLVKIKKGDLVFLDPPYTVSHYENGFVKYNAKLFDLERQLDLADFIQRIKARGAYYIMTNAAHKTIREIFNYEGDQVVTLSRASLIGGHQAKRGKFKEMIFSNTK